MSDFWKKFLWFLVPYTIFAAVIIAIPGSQPGWVIIGGATIISIVSNVAYSAVHKNNHRKG